MSECFTVDLYIPLTHWGCRYREKINAFLEEEGIDRVNIVFDWIRLWQQQHNQTIVLHGLSAKTKAHLDDHDGQSGDVGVLLWQWLAGRVWTDIVLTCHVRVNALSIQGFLRDYTLYDDICYFTLDTQGNLVQLEWQLLGWLVRMLLLTVFRISLCYCRGNGYHWDAQRYFE